jgi:hypothetical protein
MRITLEGTGELKEFIGEEFQEIELHDNAVIGDLLSVIDEKWGLIFPPHIWDIKRQKFRGPVILVVNKIPTRNMNLRLTDGDHILLVKAMVGG